MAISRPCYAAEEAIKICPTCCSKPRGQPPPKQSSSSSGRQPKLAACQRNRGVSHFLVQSRKSMPEASPGGKGAHHNRLVVFLRRCSRRPSHYSISALRRKKWLRQPLL